MTRTHQDRGDIVLGWLTKLTVVLGLLGLVGFDAISLTLGRLQNQDAAEAAARAAVTAYGDGRDVQGAYAAALDQVVDADDASTLAPQAFRVDAATGAVTLTLERTASTFLVEKVGPARTWATARATVTAVPTR